jgi:hypothetical protein
MGTIFNFLTEHDTAKRLMTQKLDSFTVVTDWQRATIRVVKGNEVVQTVNFNEIVFSLSDYERLLTNIEISVTQLKKFNNA